MFLIKDIWQNLTPLSKTFSLLVEGGAVTQIYHPDTDEFVPDHSITPVIIYPQCEIIDHDRKVPNGNVNASLAGIIWKANGSTVAGSNGYEIDTSATVTRGTLMVTRNIPPGEQLLLEFSAKYLDPRTGDLLKFAGTVMLNTNTAANEIVSAEIDNQTVIDYNPIADPATVTITPSTRLGGDPITGQRVKYFLKALENGNVRELSDFQDLEIISFNANGDGKITFDMRYVPGKKNYRLYADYVKEGDSAPSAPTIRAAIVDFSLRRRFEPYQIDLKDFGAVQPWQKEIRVEARIILSGSGKILSEPNRFFDIAYIYVNGELEKHFGYGNGASISLPDHWLSFRSKVGLSINEKRELRALSDTGLILIDDGKIVTA
jgi:hypothetical protein